eukprot:2953974-Rhodomonas_salina.5
MLCAVAGRYVSLDLGSRFAAGPSSLWLPVVVSAGCVAAALAPVPASVSALTRTLRCGDSAGAGSEEARRARRRRGGRTCGRGG